MSTAPPLSLTHDRAGKLQAYIQTYRRYALSSVPPSPERNTTLRHSQAIQGKLVTALDQKVALVQLPFLQQEMAALKTIVNDLLLLYASQQDCPERMVILTDLAALKNSLKGY